MPSTKMTGYFDPDKKDESGQAEIRTFREDMIAATQARKDLLKRYDNDIMCMIHRMGGAHSFENIHRAALAAENTLRRHRDIDAAHRALLADPLPLKIRVTAVRRSWAEFLRDQVDPEGMKARAARRFLADPERAEQLRSLLVACHARMQAESTSGLNVKARAA